MSGLEALQWMKRQVTTDARVLFRGQNREWPSIAPSITRLRGPAKTAMWALCRRFHSVASGITGFSIPNEHDRLAILQHYVLQSPVIDLTGTPEVALYFALLGAPRGGTCVVYSIDRETASYADAKFSDHAFLALPLNGGGLRHRWLRQDGYSVGPTAWRDPDAVDRFDLLKLPGVDRFTFTKTDDDGALVRHLGNLEDTAEDQMALAVRGVVTVLARHMGVMELGIAEILQRSKTRDPDAELISKIEGLRVLAESVKAPAEVLKVIRGMRSNVAHWDTSWDASAWWAQQQIDDWINKTCPYP